MLQAVRQNRDRSRRATANPEASPSPTGPALGERSPASRTRPRRAFATRRIVQQAAVDALSKLDPRHMIGNPVMFVTEIGSIVSTYYVAAAFLTSDANLGFSERSRRGSGSRFYSPTSPRPWPKGAARPRPTHSARCAPRPWPTSSPRMAWSRSRPRRCERATSCSSLRAKSSPATARSLKESHLWMSRRSPGNQRP